MAKPSYVLLLLSISQLALAMANASSYSDSPASNKKPLICFPTNCESEIKEVLYMHDIHPPRSDHNLVVSVLLPQEHGFGSITVNDWAILDAPQPNGNLVATARGTGVNTDPVNGFIYQNSFTILFGSGSRFPGSTLQVMGLNSIGQWSIVGGTGELTFARGVIKYESVQTVPDLLYYLKLSIYALYTPPAVTGNLFL